MINLEKELWGLYQEAELRAKTFCDNHNRFIDIRSVEEQTDGVSR
jgi:hypothetical protein